MRRWVLVGMVALCGAAAVARGAEPKATIVTEFRLVLVDGSTHRVRGPLERKNGTIVFRDSEGALGSIRESQVREVVPLGTRSSEKPAPPAPEAPAPQASSGPAEVGDAAIRYTNSDLTPLPEPTPLPEAPPAPEPAPAAQAPPASPPEPPTEPQAEPPSILPPPPREVAGRPESWWREKIAGLRRDIRELEAEEGETYRLWVCAMHDIPLEGGQCRPQVNRLPPVNRVPTTPTQRSLDKDLRRIRAQLDRSREDLQGFLDEAIDSGVPTAWLLAAPPESVDEPAAAPAGSDATEGEATAEPGTPPEVE